jgi:hypothetical protein
MKNLLSVTAVLEAATGLGLLALPSLLSTVILGAALDTPASLAIARVSGVALIALATACWLARDDARAGRALVVAMLLHNAGVVAVLVHGSLGLGLSGLFLWPTALVHAAMGAWCGGMLGRLHRAAD